NANAPPGEQEGARVPEVQEPRRAWSQATYRGQLQLDTRRSASETTSFARAQRSPLSASRRQTAFAARSSDANARQALLQPDSAFGSPRASAPLSAASFLLGAASVET